METDDEVKEAVHPVLEEVEYEASAPTEDGLSEDEIYDECEAMLAELEKMIQPM